MERIREVIFYKDHFLSFFESQPEKVKGKIEYVLFLISVAERIPIKFFKHIESTDGLYEVRVEYQGNAYRIFSCFDDGDLVILFNGFQKKSQKTPEREMEKALKIKAEYYNGKASSKIYENKK